MTTVSLLAAITEGMDKPGCGRLHEILAVSPDSGLYDYGPSVQSTHCTEQPMVHNFTPKQQVVGALAAFGITVALAVVLSLVWVKVTQMMKK